MKPLLIAFSGKAGSGKDTAAHALSVEHGLSFARVAFADALKEEVAHFLEDVFFTAVSPFEFTFPRVPGNNFRVISSRLVVMET